MLQASRGSNVGSNTPMNPAHDVDRRLTDLEVKASFTEDLVDHLNDVILRQQAQIDLLIREVGQLKQRAPERGTDGPRDPRDELPPHY
jgi:SlyX protein